MSWDILPKSNLQYFLTKLKGIFDNKVDKETGKGLFSGSYNDLTNKPTIPAAQVNSDWNASSGVAQILNKPTIPAAQVNSDWNARSGVAQILNKPTIPDTSTFMQKGVDRVTAGQYSGAVLGYCATSEGQATRATGNTSHAQGMGTESAASYSHSEGYDTHVLAGADAGHAEGYGVVVSGRSAHGQGYGTLASSDYQHVEGKWNVEDSSDTYAHIIGGGTSNNARKNIFTVDWDGNACDGTENRLLPFKAVSEAEYAALSQAEKTNGTAYFRYEANGIMREIQDNGSATSLTSGALPTGQTITSYLNSNLMPISFQSISAATALVSDFRHNSFISAGVLHFRGYFHHASDIADQTILFSLSGKTAKFRSEGILVDKNPSKFNAPIYINANDNKILLNSYMEATNQWCFVIIDIALN